MIGNRPDQMSVVVPQKWYWWLEVRRAYFRIDPMGWRIFEFAFISPNKVPEEGETMHDYRGFILRFSFWFPIERA